MLTPPWSPISASAADSVRPLILIAMAHHVHGVAVLCRVSQSASAETQPIRFCRCVCRAVRVESSRAGWLRRRGGCQAGIQCWRRESGPDCHRGQRVRRGYPPGLWLLIDLGDCSAVVVRHRIVQDLLSACAYCS